METSEIPSQPESTASFASKLALELQQAILQHEAGAMAGDIESVHNMRVGIRRLRVAINNFAACFGKKDWRRWRTSLENLADALGAVRDLDVMIQALKRQQAAKPEEEQAAVAKFIRRLHARRRQRLRKLLAYMRGEEYAGFKQEFFADKSENVSNLEDANNEQAA